MIKIIVRYVLLMVSILSTVSSAIENYQYRVSVCAMFQNEAPYFREWLEFHKLMGVEHFYLYNNLSSDNYLQVLMPYIEKNEVEIIDWPFYEKDWIGVQCRAYNDCLKRAYGVAQWVAFLDLDEFLFSPQHENLIDFLKNYEQFGGVCANWQLYGTSDIKQIPQNKLMIEMLLHKAPVENRRNHMVKSIVQPIYATHCTSPHFFYYRDNRYHVLPNKNSIPTPFFGYSEISIDSLRINHYWCRDEYYYINVKLPRRFSLGWTDFELLKQEVLEYNQVKDDCILRFVPKLKQHMGFME